MPKQIAATASLFILVNSLSGLVGQCLKSGLSIVSLERWELYLVVFVGGQIGSWLGAGIFLPQKVVKDCTAFIVLTVAVRLLYI